MWSETSRGYLCIQVWGQTKLIGSGADSVPRRCLCVYPRRTRIWGFFFFLSGCYRSRLGLQFCRCHEWFVGLVWIWFISGNIQMRFVSSFWRAREELFRKWWDLIMRTESLKTRRPHPSHRTFMVLVSPFPSKRLSLCQPSAIRNTCCFPLAVMSVSCLWLNLFYLAESMLLAGAVFVAFPRGSQPSLFHVYPLFS